MNLLQSALAEPRQTFGGKYLYPTIYDKAAALFRSLNKNHPLIDGNKRLALSSLGVFLALNSYAFLAPREEAVRFALEVAKSERTPQVKIIARWIRKHTISIRIFNSATEGQKRDWSEKYRFMLASRWEYASRTARSDVEFFKLFAKDRH